jgi:hypothetical protein
VPEVLDSGAWGASKIELEASELDWFADFELNLAVHAWLGDADGDETDKEEEVPGDVDMDRDELSDPPDDA